MYWVSARNFHNIYQLSILNEFHSLNRVETSSVYRNMWKLWTLLFHINNHVLSIIHTFLKLLISLNLNNIIIKIVQLILVNLFFYHLYELQLSSYSRSKVSTIRNFLPFFLVQCLVRYIRNSEDFQIFGNFRFFFDEFSEPVNLGSWNSQCT